MPNRHAYPSSVAHPAAPHGHGGASSILRVGPAALPQRVAPLLRTAGERPPFLLQQRHASLQMSLFGPQKLASR